VVRTGFFWCTRRAMGHQGCSLHHPLVESAVVAGWIRR
jgi:hypothetical protein